MVSKIVHRSILSECLQSKLVSNHAGNVLLFLMIRLRMIELPKDNDNGGHRTHLRCWTLRIPCWCSLWRRYNPDQSIGMIGLPAPTRSFLFPCRAEAINAALRRPWRQTSVCRRHRGWTRRAASIVGGVWVGDREVYPGRSRRVRHWTSAGSNGSFRGAHQSRE